MNNKLNWFSCGSIILFAFFVTLAAYFILKVHTETSRFGLNAVGGRDIFRGSQVFETCNEYGQISQF